MHAIEKILARASGKTSVTAGEFIVARVDFAEVNDLYLQTLASFYEMGGDKVWDKERLAFVFDHYAPPPTIKAARNHAEMRSFAKDNALSYHFDVNAGVCHQVLPEAGLVLPGDIIVATDSHATIHGAFGAFGTGLGATDMATVMMTGELWLRVPQIIGVRINGRAAPGIYPKDVILHVLRTVRADGAIYKAIDFFGDYVDALGVAGRMVLCNMAVEMGAKTAYIQPNDAVQEYVSARARRPFAVTATDPDFEYAQIYDFDISSLAPLLAAPGGVDNVVEIKQAAGIPVNQGLIGTCTGGRTEDIETAAAILRGRHIPPYVRLIVAPASAQILQECLNNGCLQDLIDAGATMISPGCGPCLGAHAGILAPGEICVTASNRNFPGRMGSAEAQIYLASPATVAASVLEGRIADPRAYL